MYVRAKIDVPRGTWHVHPVVYMLYSTRHTVVTPAGYTSTTFGHYDARDGCPMSHPEAQPAWRRNATQGGSMTTIHNTNTLYLVAAGILNSMYIATAETQLSNGDWAYYIEIRVLIACVSS